MDYELDGMLDDEFDVSDESNTMGDDDAFNADDFADDMGEEDMFADEFIEFEDFEGADPFFGKLIRRAKRIAKKVAPLAKRFAPQIGTVLGTALGGPAGAALGGKIGSFVRTLEGEYEDDEGESEDELNADIDVSPDDDMIAEAMASAAAKSKPSDAQTLGSALTITIASKAPLEVKQVSPTLAKAGGELTKALAKSGDPRAKALVNAVPTIQKKTVATLKRKVEKGKPVTPKTAVRVMAKQAKRTLGSERALTKALANNAVKKHKLDKKAISRAERMSDGMFDLELT